MKRYRDSSVVIMLESFNMKVLLQLSGSEPPIVYDTGRVANAPLTNVPGGAAGTVHTLATHLLGDKQFVVVHVGTTGTTGGDVHVATPDATTHVCGSTHAGEHAGTTGTAGDVHVATPDVVTHVCGSTHAGEHAGVRR